MRSVLNSLSHTCFKCSLCKNKIRETIQFKTVARNFMVDYSGNVLLMDNHVGLDLMMLVSISLS